MNMRTLWKGQWISVVSPEKYPYEAVYEPDGVIVLPILYESGNKVKFGVRKELIPPYTVQDGDKKFYTVISGGIDKGETPGHAIVRELKEEAGLTMNQHIVVYHKPLHISKLSTAVSHILIIKVMKYEFQKPTTDGTKYEAVASTLWVDENELQTILKSDTVDFLLTGVYAIYRNQGAKG